METIELTVRPRMVTGKKVAALRHQGIVPLHLYGRGVEPLTLQGDTRTIQRIVVQAGKNVLISLKIEGDQGNQNVAFIREVQRHPVTGKLLHVDFLRNDVREKIETDVPLALVGDAPAVRTLSGILFQGMYTLRIECLPMDIPETIQVDVSTLDNFERSIRVKDLSVSSAITILSDPEELVTKVNPPRVVEVEEAVAVPKEEEEEKKETEEA